MQEDIQQEVGSSQLMSQLSSTMMSQMTAEGSQSSRLLLHHGPLPDSEFVQNNRPRARPGVPLTTATKAGRQAAAAKKGKASKKNSQTGGDGQESSKQRKAAKTNTKIGGDGQAPTKKRKLAKK